MSTSSPSTSFVRFRNEVAAICDGDIYAALLLEKLNYLLNEAQFGRTRIGSDEEERRYVQFSYKQWTEELNFRTPGLHCQRTIERALSLLREKGFVRTEQFSRSHGDCRLWWALVPEKINDALIDACAEGKIEVETTAAQLELFDPDGRGRSTPRSRSKEPSEQSRSDSPDRKGGNDKSSSPSRQDGGSISTKGPSRDKTENTPPSSPPSSDGPPPEPQWPDDPPRPVGEEEEDSSIWEWAWYTAAWTTGILVGKDQLAHKHRRRARTDSWKAVVDEEAKVLYELVQQDGYSPALVRSVVRHVLQGSSCMMTAHIHSLEYLLSETSSSTKTRFEAALSLTRTQGNPAACNRSSSQRSSRPNSSQQHTRRQPHKDAPSSSADEAPDENEEIASQELVSRLREEYNEKHGASSSQQSGKNRRRRQRDRFWGA